MFGDLLDRSDAGRVDSQRAQSAGEKAEIPRGKAVGVVALGGGQRVVGELLLVGETELCITASGGDGVVGGLELRAVSVGRATRGTEDGVPEGLVDDQHIRL